jgi:hypothetical protein
VASFRFHHRSFGLYFLAANVDADVTVLDFPSRRRFIKEIKKGYDSIGISFITPNFLKAREMARLIRLHSPGTEIILGGHGAAIEGVEKLIECDHVVKGEGIRWLRSHFGQDPHAPIAHPVLPSTEVRRIYGVPIPGVTASLLVPGVGCVNGCRFCSTSHFFGKKYTSFAPTGRDLFDTACRIADARGSDSFFVMDENFLKDHDRSLQFLEEMHRRRRYFTFHMFSSAEAVTSFGIENLVRLGVSFLWIGVESRNEKGNYDKNAGVDQKRLIKELKDNGISVMASTILCNEHHTPENIEADIDFTVDLNADYVQFMLLTPLPVTTLYAQKLADGSLRTDLPYEDWHGQKEMTYRHPEFGPGEPEHWINTAFRRDFEINSSSMYRSADTALRGYRTLASRSDRDHCLEARMAQLADRTRLYGQMLPAVVRHAVNRSERDRARALNTAIQAELGSWSLKERGVRGAVRLLSEWWNLRIRLFGDSLQPSTIVTRFDRSENGAVRGPVPVVEPPETAPRAPEVSAAAAITIRK